MPGTRQAYAASGAWRGGNAATSRNTVRGPAATGAIHSRCRSQKVGTTSYGSGLTECPSGSVAMLVLLAAPAGAGFVSPHLRGIAPEGHLRQAQLGLGLLRARRGAVGRRRRPRWRGGGLRALGPGASGEDREHVLEGGEVRRAAEEARADLQAHVSHQLLEEPVRLALVLDQGVLLPVAAQAYRAAQLLHLGQVFLPVVVDRVDDDVALHGAERVGYLNRLLDGVGLLDPLEYRGLELAGVVARQLLDLEPDREMGVGPSHEALDGGRVGPALLAEPGDREPANNLLLDLLEDDVLRARRVDGPVPDPVDDLPLHVEHVVVLEEPLADGVILLLDLLLGRLDRAVEPGMLELLALLHRALHQARGEVALEEESHEVVLEREEELRQPGVALARAAPAQLPVDPARLVALGSDHV